MNLIFLIGNYLLWAFLTILSGAVGGFGLAAGFYSFKRTKEWIQHKRNKSYIKEEEFMAASEI